MADTEDVAKVLTDYVVDSEHLNMHIPSIQRKMEDIVLEWYIDILDARAFVKRMKARTLEEYENNNGMQEQQANH
jgi:hypothetical protein